MHGPPDGRRLAPRARRRIIIGLIACAIVLVLVAVPLARWWFVKRQVQAELAHIRASGEPANHDELAEFAPVVSEIDPVEKFLMLSDSMFRDLPFILSSRPVLPGQLWPHFEHAQAVVLRNPELVAYRNIARANMWRDDWFQHYASWYLSFEACIRAHERDSAAVVTLLADLFSSTSAGARAPRLGDLLTRCELEDAQRQLVLGLLPRLDWGDADLQRLFEAIDTPSFIENYEFVTVCARARVLGDFSRHDLFDPYMLVENDDRLMYLQTMRRYLEALRSDAQTGLRVGAEIDAQLNAGREERNEIRPVLGRRLRSMRMRRTLYAIYLLNVEYSWALRSEALRRATLGAIAIERYRLAHGEPPAALDELVPDFLTEVPKDPIDERPLRYRLLHDKIVLYSIGTNAVDDRGVQESWNDALEVFRLDSFAHRFSGGAQKDLLDPPDWCFTIDRRPIVAP